MSPCVHPTSHCIDLHASILSEETREELKVLDELAYEQRQKDEIQKAIEIWKKGKNNFLCGAKCLTVGSVLSVSGLFILTKVHNRSIGTSMLISGTGLGIWGFCKAVKGSMQIAGGLTQFIYHPLIARISEP